MIDFKIKSTELRDYQEWHNCFIKGVYGDNKLIIGVVPPIPFYVYDSKNDIDEIILSPKFKGDKLTPNISSFPMNVYICKENNGELEILDWGVIEI